MPTQRENQQLQIKSLAICIWVEKQCNSVPWELEACEEESEDCCDKAVIEEDTTSSVAAEVFSSPVVLEVVLPDMFEC